MWKLLTTILDNLDIDNAITQKTRSQVKEIQGLPKQAQALADNLIKDLSVSNCIRCPNHSFCAIFLACISFELKDLPAAKKHFKKAVKNFSLSGSLWNQTLATWGYAEILVALKEDMSAQREFDRAKENFKNMAQKFRDKDEYEKRNLSLQFATEIKARIDDVFIDTSQEVTETKPAQTTHKVQGVKPTKKNNWKRSSLAYPAISHIKAGKNGSAIFAGDSSPDVTIDEVVINENTYFMYNCRKEGDPIILGSKVHCWFQVEGDSMNLAEPIPILDGDYILVIDVRLSIHDVKIDDIVTAEIFNAEQHERSGAVKKYTLDGLVSMSTEDYLIIPDSDFAIQGVVIAIAKPSPQTAPFSGAELSIPEALKQAISVEKDAQVTALFKNLLIKTSRDHREVVRLIEYEQKLKPSAPLKELIQNAIDQWMRDN